MKGLKVAIVTESASVWGAEQTLLGLLEQFEHLRISATTVVSIGSPFTAVLKDRGHDVVEYRFANHPALQGGSFSSASWRKIAMEPVNILASGARLAKVFKGFDLAVSFSLWQSPETIIACRLRRIPCVVDLHETFSGTRSRHLTQIIGRLSTAVIAPSLSIVNNSGLEVGPKVQVIGRPVTIATTDNPVINVQHPITVGIFGQVVPHKGVHQLVSAVERLPAGQLNLMVVGGTEAPDRRTCYEAELRDRVAKLPNSQFVNRVGTVSEYMRRCHIVVNLSQHEAFGRTVVEAISCGAYPVVLSGSGPAEIVRATGVGRILDVVEELEGFLRILSQPSGSYALNELFMNRAEWPKSVARFSAEAVGLQYADVLRGTSKL